MRFLSLNIEILSRSLVVEDEVGIWNDGGICEMLSESEWQRIGFILIFSGILHLLRQKSQIKFTQNDSVVNKNKLMLLD